MAKKRSNSKSVKQSNGSKALIITLASLLSVLLLTYVGLSIWRNTWNPAKWVTGLVAAEKTEEETVCGQLIVTTETDSISPMSLRATRGIDTTHFQLNVEITPEEKSEFFKSFQWSTAWASEIAANVSDYIAVTPVEGLGGRVVEVEYKQQFIRPVTITCKSGEFDMSARCRVDCVQVPEYMWTKNRGGYEVTSNDEQITINDFEWTTGTVQADRMYGDLTLTIEDDAWDYFVENGLDLNRECYYEGIDLVGFTFDFQSMLARFIPEEAEMTSEELLAWFAKCDVVETVSGDVIWVTFSGSYEYKGQDVGQLEMLTECFAISIDDALDRANLDSYLQDVNFGLSDDNIAF